MKSYYMGIDPGTKGAIAIYQEYEEMGLALRKTGKCIIDVLRLSKATDTDICEFMSKYAPDTVYAVIEKVGSMPGQGVASTFKFGKAYGGLSIALQAFKIPHRHVTPQKWQAGLGIASSITGNARKKALKAVAQQRFPQRKWVLENCDAPLIAEYASTLYAPF